MKSLTFVIPVYNEEKRLNIAIKALEKGFCYDGIKLEKIIFVDDGSKDSTYSIICNSKSKIEVKTSSSVEIISYKENKGKGYAVRAGMLASTSDYTLFFDVDMATPLSEFKKFLPFINKNVPVIIGTRKNEHSTVVVPQPIYRQLLGKVFTLISNIILNTWVSDFTCGFKAFSREAKDEIFSRAIINRWGYDAEILFLARKMDFKIYEKALLWRDDKDSRVCLIKDIPGTFIELLKMRIFHLRLENKMNYAPTYCKLISINEI